MHKRIVFVFTRTLVRKHMYHPCVHFLTLKMEARASALRVVQWVYTHISTFPSPEKKTPTTILLGWDSNPHPASF